MRSIVHIEIPFSDAEKTSKFYQDFCGWEFQTDKQLDYHMFKGGNIEGGLSPIGEDTKAGDVLIYIGSDDIDADLEKVQALGAQIVQPRMEVPNTGVLAVFLDPAGNRIALWQDF
ncbi:MAG: VOC family protein [Chloroflexota bacterium]